MKNNGRKINTEKMQEKNFNLKKRYWPLEFNIRNSCDLPNFCNNYIVNLGALHDARLLSAD